jgi:segregation and condensation protein A
MAELSAPRPVPRVDLDHVAPIRLSVSDAVAELAGELSRLGRSSFRRLTEGVGPRLEVIIRFLALLEMYKQGMVELEQTTNFAELYVSWLGDDGDAATSALDVIDIEEYQG